MVSDPIKNSRQPLPNYNANSQSESRRKFLGILAAGVASIAMPNFALAGSNFSELPPGYQSKLCDDEMLQIAFAIMYRVKRYRGTNEQVKSMLIDNGVNFYGFPKIDFKNTPLKEPGYWFAKTYFNAIVRGNISEIKYPISKEKIRNKKPAMFHWNEGIIAYSDAWMNKNKSSKFAKPCEEHFAKSLVLASGRDESEYTQLITAIENEDKKCTDKLLEDLSKRGKVDKKIAGWVSCFMTNNYFLNGEFKKKRKGGVMFNLEGKIKNDFRQFRGPPYYYDSSGSFKA